MFIKLRAVVPAIAIAVVAIAVTPGLATVSQTDAQTQKYVCDKGKNRHGHWHSRSDLYRGRLQRAWSRVKGPRSSERKKYIHVRRCALFPQKVDKRWKRAKQKYASLRAEKREARSYLVYSGGGHKWAIPWDIVACESGGSWAADNPSSDARGPYQLLGHGEPWPVVSKHDKRMHHIIAGRLYNGGAGRGAWVC